MLNIDYREMGATIQNKNHLRNLIDRILGLGHSCNTSRHSHDKYVSKLSV